MPGPIRTITLLSFLALLASCTHQGKGIPRLTDKVSFEPFLAKSLTEGRRTVRGRISFDPQHLYSFNLETKGFRSETLSVELAGKTKDLPPLDTGKTYKVELLTRIYKDPDYVFNSLLRISLDDRVIHDESVCGVHRRPMKREMEHGVSAEDYPDSFDSLRERTFPNDGNAYLLCGSGIGHPGWKCPECHAACLRAEKRFGIPKY